RIELHELVGIPGIAVFAADLAAAIRIDGPTEGHIGFGAVQDAPRRNFKILHAALGFEQFALGSESGDPHECHRMIFAFYSPFSKGKVWRILTGVGQLRAAHLAFPFGSGWDILPQTVNANIRS